MSFLTNIQQICRKEFITHAERYKFNDTYNEKVLINPYRCWVTMSPEVYLEFNNHWLLPCNESTQPFPNIIHSPFGLCIQILKEELDFVCNRLDITPNVDLEQCKLNHPNLSTILDVPMFCTGTFVTCYNYFMGLGKDTDWETEFDHSTAVLYSKTTQVKELTELTEDRMLDLISLFYGIELSTLISILNHPQNAISGSKWMDEMVDAMSNIKVRKTFSNVKFGVMNEF